MQNSHYYILLKTILISLVGLCIGCDNKTGTGNVITGLSAEKIDLKPYYEESQLSDKLFRLVPTEESGLNVYGGIKETMSHNFFNYRLLYGGTGIGAGDFDNDGLVDLFVANNFEPNRLFKNTGGLKFEDKSTTSGIQDSTGFTYGVTVVDVNQDGWLDVYVCKAGGEDIPAPDRANRLYINNHDFTFTEKAVEYGLADETSSLQAYFFDYDRDGDLDIYLLTQWLNDKQLGSMKTLVHIEKGINQSDRFYINNGDGTYSDISSQAGVNNNGIGWSSTTGDYNMDGWPDVYVANDFIMYNYLYMNNQNGGFRQSIFDNLDKMTRFGMGSHTADWNNDGFPNVMVSGVSMFSQRRQRSMLDMSGTKKFDARIASGYHYQVPRNTLQINDGDGHFSEIASFAHLNSANWGWAILADDYDNDGWSDVFVANGFAWSWKLDDRLGKYGKLRSAVKTRNIEKYRNIRNQLDKEAQRYSNEIFQNRQGLKFDRKTSQWGLDLPTISHGAVSVDFDNDGDVDILATNLDQEVVLYENRSQQLQPRQYMKIAFEGVPPNRDGWGTKVHLYDVLGELLQFKEFCPTDGYLSTSDHRLHFGLGERSVVPKLLVTWPDGRQQMLTSVAANTTITLNYSDAGPAQYPLPQPVSLGIATSAEASVLDYRHRENNFDDFDRQFTLHYKQSRHGPGMAVADANGDGADDIYFSGAKGQPAALYLQNTAGQLRPSPQPALEAHATQEGLGALFFDADGDGDQDLYQCNGGGIYSNRAEVFQDQLYLNDGAGNFVLAPAGSLPSLQSSGGCTVAGDYDGDGDLDLFVGGRVVPSFYPQAPRSYLLRNDGGRFTGVTPAALQTPGMVTAALWTDYNQDDAIDLLLAGDWMPLRLFANQDGQLQEVDMGLTDTEGWWNSITGADFDADGDTDYLLGNAGLNHVRLARGEFPLKLHHGDFNGDEQYDLFYTYEKEGEEWPVYGFAAFQKQFPEWKHLLNGFSHYARRSFPTIRERLFPGQGDSLMVNTFTNVWMENKGDGTFELHALPRMAQLSPIFGAVTGDFDGDGHLDALCHGNFYPAHIAFEKQDAGRGLFLKGDGQGGFEAYRGIESGFLSKGDARGLVLVNRPDRVPLLVAAHNDAVAPVFELPKAQPQFRFQPTDHYALVQTKNGKVQRIENYHGCGYLSQSSSSQMGVVDWTQIAIFDGQGQRTTIYPGQLSSR